MQKKYYELYHKNTSPKSLSKLCLFDDRCEFYKIDIADLGDKNITDPKMVESTNLLKTDLLLLEIRFDDFIGVEVKGNEIIFHTTGFPRGCLGCSSPDKKFRKIARNHFF